ncbi:MAG: GntR family transcriptional regulator [Rectinemataceae bacterium]
MLETLGQAVSIDRISISDQAYTHIKKLILSGELKAGEKIPEKRVADLFKVSRTPIREAMRKLAEYGLIVIKPRSYAYVATINTEEAKDISWVRLYLEKLSVRLFAAAANDASYARLYELARNCREANDSGDYAAAYEYDSTLHREIARGTGNKELYAMLQMLDAKLQLLRLKQHLPHNTLAEYFSQHEKLVRLLANKEFQKIDELLEVHIMHDLSF